MIETGKEPSTLKTPNLCVDLIIDMGSGLILLLDRADPPYGWALPGGFVEIGESVEEAALRECYEETGLEVELVRQFHVYSNPSRDDRGHSASVVFVARANGKVRISKESKNSGVYHEHNLPENIPFDHRQILKDYFLQRY